MGPYGIPIRAYPGMDTRQRFAVRYTFRMSIMVWAGKCKNPECGKLSAVRPSESNAELGRIEFPNPSRISEVVCPHCGTINEFSDVELKQVHASVFRS